jgi:hypothetical protein
MEAVNPLAHDVIDAANDVLRLDNGGSITLSNKGAY